MFREYFIFGHSLIHKSFTNMAKSARKKAEKPTASLMEDGKETAIHVEEIPAPKALAIIPADKKAEMEIARYDVARSWIAERKEQYQDLAITGVDDKDGIKSVTAAWQEIRNKRLAVQNKHTEIKADYLVITRAIDKEKNELVDLLKDIEDPLKAEIDRIENEKLAAKQEEDRKAAAALQARVDTLIQNGMAFNGRYYAIGEVVSIDVVTLKDLGDDEFDKLLGRVKTENQAILDAQAEKERKDQAEKDALEKTRLEQEETTRLQNEKQAELDRKTKELEDQKMAMLAARTKARGKMLEAAGVGYNFGGRVFEFKTADCGVITLPIGSIEGMEDEQWEPEYDTIVAKVKELKEQQGVKDKERTDKLETDRLQREKEKQDAEAKQHLIATRKSELMAYLGMQEQPDGSFIRRFKFEEITPLLITKSQLESYEAEPWAKELKDLQAYKDDALQMLERLQKAQDIKTETARQGALSDVERVNEFLRDVAAAMTRRPEIKDAKIAAAFTEFDESITEAVTVLGAVLDAVI
jgi:hypothetical protein